MLQVEFYEDELVKKSQKTPPKEIALAKKRRKDYLTREEH